MNNEIKNMIAEAAAQDFAQNVGHQFERLAKVAAAHGWEKTLLSTEKSTYHLVRALKPFFEEVEGEREVGRRAPVIGIETKADAIAKAAGRYGEAMAANFIEKFNAKLGEVENVECQRASSGWLLFTATKGGHKVTVDQARVLKVSSNGKWFHQWPARIYVDGKFTPEAKFKAMFE